jgi:hypothetical protein
VHRKTTDPSSAIWALAFATFSAAACGGAIITGGTGDSDASGNSPDSGDSCDSSDPTCYGALAICECMSEDAGCTVPMTIDGPGECKTNADCPRDQLCTSEFDDTMMCSPKCYFDGGGCPVGYACKVLLP